MVRKVKGVVMTKEYKRQLEEERQRRIRDKDRYKMAEVMHMKLVALQRDMFASFAYALRNSEKYGNVKLNRVMKKAFEYFNDMQLFKAGYHFTADDVDDVLLKECNFDIDALIKEAMQNYTKEEARFERR